MANDPPFATLNHVAGDLGIPSESALLRIGITQSLTHEYFGVKFDGLVQSGHRRFVDAVRAGLQLKDHFPQHDVKVDSIQVTDATEGLAQDPVLH